MSLRLCPPYRAGQEQRAARPSRPAAEGARRISPRPAGRSDPSSVTRVGALGGQRLPDDPHGEPGRVALAGQHPGEPADPGRLVEPAGRRPAGGRRAARAARSSASASTTATASPTISPSTPRRRSSAASARRARPRPACRESTQAAANARSSMRPTSVKRTSTVVGGVVGDAALGQRGGELGPGPRLQRSAAAGRSPGPPTPDPPARPPDAPAPRPPPDPDAAGRCRADRLAIAARGLRAAGRPVATGRTGVSRLAACAGRRVGAVGGGAPSS